MKFVLQINLKLLKIANISFLLNIDDDEDFFANKHENANYSRENFHAQVSWAWKLIYSYNPGVRPEWLFFPQ